MAGESIDDDLPPDKVREPREVAMRAVTLFAAVGAALGAPREQIVPWLHEHGLWGELSPAEAMFLTTLSDDRQSRINFGWQSERLLVLLWALGKIPNLPRSDEQCDTGKFQAILPPYSESTVADFLQGAILLSEDVLIAKAEELLDQHWQARNARITGDPMPQGIDIEIVQERHHAINWITGYCGLPWDEVTTDT